MNKRATGAAFCAIAALLFAARYIAAAIFMSNDSSWSANLFAAGLEYVGVGLPIASGIALAVGIFYLAWAEMENRGSRRDG